MKQIYWLFFLIIGISISPSYQQASTACLLTPNGVSVRSSQSCRHYFQCSNNNGIPQVCQSNELFNAGTQQCLQQSLSVDCLECSSFGIQNIRDPDNCDKYFSCVFGTRYHESCPPNLHFDTVIGQCNLPSEANCAVRSPLCDDHPFGEVFIPNLTDCERFYQCIDGVAIPHICANGLYWNNAQSKCDLYENSDCPLVTTTTPAPTTTTPAPTTTTPAPTTAITIPTTTDEPSEYESQCCYPVESEPEITCQRFGFQYYPGNCRRFVFCLYPGARPTSGRCLIGYWNSNRNRCQLRNPCRGVEITTETTPIPTTEIPTTLPPPTEPPVELAECCRPVDPEFELTCSSFGYKYYPGDCTRYVFCLFGGSSPVIRNCSSGYWNSTTSRCEETNPCLIVTEPPPPTTTTTESPTTLPPTPPPTPPTTTEWPSDIRECCKPVESEVELTCTSFGNQHYPGDCTRYLFCIFGGANPIIRECSVGLFWNPETSRCEEGNPCPDVTPPTPPPPPAAPCCAAAEDDFYCAGFGLHYYPGDCTRFATCFFAGWPPVISVCRNGFWNSDTNACQPEDPCSTPTIPPTLPPPTTTLPPPTTTIPPTTTTTLPPTTTTEEPTTTQAPIYIAPCCRPIEGEPEIFCTGFGVHYYPGDCTRFATCFFTGATPIISECRDGFWNSSTYSCQSQDPCGTSTSPPPGLTPTVDCCDKSDVSNDLTCTERGFKSYRGDCNKFIICESSLAEPIISNCPNGYWDNERHICTLEDPCEIKEPISKCNADCCDGDQNEIDMALEDCTAVGFNYYPGDCGKFISCTHVGGKPFVNQCRHGLYWNKMRNTCLPDNPCEQ